ncbi:MAG TPA: ADOP family duplicated permease [Candidatus Baltobacteraceae bacterium]
MHPLLRFALWSCPRDFRDRYGNAIARDASERRISFVLVALDLIYQGSVMRAESVARDIAYGARTLARSPTYTIVAAIAIALAIAANVAVVSVLNGILLRPLPYPSAERIASVTSGAQNLTNAPFSYLDARDLGAATGNTLQAFGISSPDATATLSGIARPVILQGNDVDAGYFRVLGARAALGRVFLASDLGTHHVIISDRLWRTFFNANPAVLGRTMQLDGATYSIVGVMGARFRDVTPIGLVRRDYWTAADPQVQNNLFRGTITYNGWALLRSGTSFASAQADVDRAMSEIVRRYPVVHEGWGKPLLRPALETIVAPVRSMLWLLYATVLLLLIIACANVINLTLTRATTRRGEFAIRGALGASRTRLAAQLCSETALLSAIGGVAGLALGWGALRIFSSAASRILPRWEGVHVDLSVLGYVVGVLVLTTIATGIIPALSSRHTLVAGLKAAGRSGDVAASKALRSSFVIAEIALALAVVLSAGLVVRSFIALMQVPVGFDGQNLYAADAPGLPSSRYPSHEAGLRAVDRIAMQLQGIPGVQAVAITSGPPFLAEENTYTSFPDHLASEPVDLNVVSARYFKTMRIPLLRGRDFDQRDRLTSEQVAIVNAAFARRYFGTLEVLGRTYHPHIGWKGREIRTIIGVVGDTRNSFHAPIAPVQYLTTKQVPGIFAQFVIRTNGQDGELAQAVARAYGNVDPLFPAPSVRAYRQLFSEDAGSARVAAMLFGVFALIALVLALAGIYAITTYGVEQRTRELGVRKALGASDRAVLADVLIGALRISAFGIALGLAVAALGARLLTTILFQTSPFDPLTFGAAIALVVLSSLFAAYVPALRATRVQPAIALSYE